MINLSQHFKHQSRTSAEFQARERWLILDRERREEKREKEAREEQAELDALAIEVVMASMPEIEAFEAKLDTFDTATIVALQQNQQRLDAVNAHIEEMLGNAYVLEDGRRVFKTANGLQVFDENGNEVASDELDFGLIGPERPTWESFSERLSEQAVLLQERQELHDYQSRLDEARERVNAKDGISKDELDSLDSELAEAMPESVRQHLPEKLRPERKAELETEPSEPVIPAKVMDGPSAGPMM